MKQKSRKTILIIDDDESWRPLLAALLEDEFIVDTINPRNEDPLTRITQIKNPYHVIVTDIRYNDDEEGNEEGLRLIEQIGQKGKHTKIIVITGYSTIKTARRALSSLNAFEYLEKRPSGGTFDISEFQRAVRKAAEQAEQEMQLARQARKRLDVFVLMPFAEEYKTFYENVIKKTMERINISCKRADDLFGPRRIMQDIHKSIKDAHFILSDFSGRNPNVFFEVGISHALGKSVILLSQKLDDVPPKLRVIRCLVYENTLAGARKIAPNLEKAIQEIQANDVPSLFAPSEFNVKSRHCLALMPNNSVGQQTYDDLVFPVMKDAKYKCYRSEEIYNSFSILDEIWTRINSAELIVADLTGRDPDVFYLTGLAYGLGKKIIYIAQKMDDIPFDLKEGSCLIYSLKSYEEGLKAQKRLAQSVKTLLKR
ncbi:MAG: response regulator [Chloroflexota bacterium]